MNPFHRLTQQERGDLLLNLLRAIAANSHPTPIALDWNALWGNESDPLGDPVITLLRSYINWLEGGQA